MMSRSEFVEQVLYKIGYRGRARIVGFNLPFDIARLAIDVEEARGKDLGGFSFILWPGAPGSGLQGAPSSTAASSSRVSTRRVPS